MIPIGIDEYTPCTAPAGPFPRIEEGRLTVKYLLPVMRTFNATKAGVNGTCVNQTIRLEPSHFL